MCTRAFTLLRSGIIKTNTTLPAVSAAGPGLRCYLTEMKLGHLCWDSALDLWLLDQFELGFFASRSGLPKRTVTPCLSLRSGKPRK